jgi:hypothetical protein
VAEVHTGLDWSGHGSRVVGAWVFINPIVRSALVQRNVILDAHALLCEGFTYTDVKASGNVGS